MCFLNVEAHKSPSIFCLCIHVSQELFSFGFSSFQCISSAVSKAMLPKKRKLWTPSQPSQPKGHDWAPTKQVEWVRGNVAPTVWPTRECTPSSSLYEGTPPVFSPPWVRMVFAKPTWDDIARCRPWEDFQSDAESFQPGWVLDPTESEAPSTPNSEG